MKTSSAALYRLIHQMAPVEKRYFRKYANRHIIRGENDYYELFELIMENDCQSDGEISKLIEDKSYKNYFPVAKSNLFESILDAFHQYETAGSIPEKIKAGIHQTRILLNKGFFKECNTKIKKYRNLIVKFELFSIMPELLQVEKQLIAKSYYRNNSEKLLKELFDEEMAVYTVLQRENEYWMIFSRIYKIHFTQLRSRKPADEQKLKQLLNSPLIKNEDNAISFKCKMDFFQINALKNFMAGDAKLASHFNRKFIEEFDSHPQMMKIYPERYLSTFNNYLIDLYNGNEMGPLKIGIERLLNLPTQKEFKRIPNIDIQVFRLGEQFLLNLGIQEKRYNENVARIPGLNKKLEKYGDAIAEQNLVTFYYLFACSYFGVHQYEACIKWTDRIIDETNEDALVELQLSARLVNLIAHYEIGNDDLLYYTVNNTRRYHSRRQRLFEFEKTMLSALNRLIGKLPEERKKTFTKLETDLTKLSAIPGEKQAMNNFDFLGWVQGHLS